MLPQMVNNDGISKWRSVEFGGIRHVLGAGTGEIWDCYGITPASYPVLRSGDFVKYDSDVKGLYGAMQFGTAEADCVYVNNETLFYRGTQVFANAALNKKQQIVAFNNFALLFPSKLWVRTDVKALVNQLPASGEEYGEVYAVINDSEYDAYYWDGSAWVSLGKMAGEMESSATTNATFIDGTYAGEDAEANTIRASSSSYNWANYFSVGDAVTITAPSNPENNKTIIIREISGRDLRFYEHSFTKNTTAASITVKRTVPAMDWVCVNESRVWGVHGKHVYASKLGDFKNWNVFDGLASDSYAVDVMSAGDFTGCVSFMGYPVLFKRSGIYKIYGNRPSNFEVMGSASTGCVNGNTLAIAAETLFYLSERGVMSYNGGMPQLISQDLGDLITGSENAFGGTDDNKYYIVYADTDTALIFDPEKGMWHKQIYQQPNQNKKLSYAYRGHNGVVLVTTEGMRYGNITGSGTQSNAFYVEFADSDESQSDAPQYGANKKGTSKVQIRMVLGQNSDVTVSMMFDSDGVWREVKSFTTANVKRSFYLPIIPRRSDHFRIRFAGHGNFELYSLSRENYTGSAL